MHELLVAISNLVRGQRLTIEVDDMDRYLFKLETDFGREAKPFWVITPQTMQTIKYHFENDELGENLAVTINHLIERMDEAVIHNEPETY